MINDICAEPERDGRWVTVLRSRGLRLAKRWTAAGAIEAYDDAKHFDAETVRVDGIEALAKVVGGLETDPCACIIRGTLKDGVSSKRVRRILDNFDDVPLRWILVEIDGYRPLGSDPVTEPVEALREYVGECLPPEFHGVRGWWQLSGSAGHESKVGQLKAHLWFWLDQPWSSAQLRTWGRSLGLCDTPGAALDGSVLNPVQVHYTAAPVVESGAVCPVPAGGRSGWLGVEGGEGWAEGVALRIPDDVLARVREGKARRRGERLEGVEDSLLEWLQEGHWETWETTESGGLVVSCPFADGHSAVTDGSTSTVYFPAGSGGHAERFWNCKHASCSQRSQGEFDQAVGWIAEEMRQASADSGGGAGSEGSSGGGSRPSSVLDLGNAPDEHTPLYVRELNQEFAVVRYGADVKVMLEPPRGEALVFLDRSDFLDMFKNQQVLVAGSNKPANKGDAWLAHPDRRQHLHPGVVFRPGVSAEVLGPGGFNLWRGMGVDPAPGDWSLMRAHLLDVVCGGVQAHLEWLLDWLALGVQRLDRPLGVVVVLKGSQGAGKGVIAHNYGALFGEHYAYMSDADSLTGRFNSELGTAMFACLDEAVFSADSKQANKLKALVTEPKIVIERKFCDRIEVPNRLRLMFSTNEQWAAPVEATDRRYAVFDVSDKRREDFAYFEALVRQMETGGREAWLFDLLRRDLGDRDIRQIPMTAARGQQKVLSLKGVDSWLHELLTIGEAGSTSDFGTWDQGPVEANKDEIYQLYLAHSARRREYRPLARGAWGREVHRILGDVIDTVRPRGSVMRTRFFKFNSLEICRKHFAKHIGVPDLEWEDD